VYLVKNMKDNQFYAMKVIRKIDYLNERRIIKIYSEKKVKILAADFSSHLNEILLSKFRLWK
jgi:hypothetical protein